MAVARQSDGGGSCGIITEVAGSSAEPKLPGDHRQGSDRTDETGFLSPIWPGAYMGRYIGPVCRLCRREGLKLMLKGTRCETAKCAMDRKWASAPPGMHAWRRRKAGDYGVRF